MALRIFLVSAVTCLGLTFPEEKEVRTWTATTLTWASTRLAGWGLHSVDEGRDAVLAARCEMSGGGESAAGDLAFHAAMEETLRSFSTKCDAASAHEERVTTLSAPTFEPMVIGEDLYSGTAYALNRASEGVDIPRPAIAERAAPARSQSMTVVAESLSDAMHVSGWDDRGPDRCRADETSGRRGGDFEPMVVGEDLYAGVAYSLNRASDGLGLASDGPSSQPPSDASRVSQLSVALRLTREAVYAWSNLLHAPAVVAISR